MKQVFFLIILVSIYTGLSGCKATAVKNIEETKFVAPRGVSLSQVERAIIQACRKSGWRVKSSNRNKVIASYSYKRNKFGAVVSINYDRDSYEINYVSSHNLKYTERQNPVNNVESDDFWNESQQTIAEINPFKKQTQGSAGQQQNKTIHKIYNKWVTVLDQNINQALNNLGARRYTASTSGTSSRSRTRTMSASSKQNTCHDQPTANASGNAIITKSVVNIRSGVGTKCAVVGSVSRNETFTLLGKKNNWYYISTTRNQKAWIYAPLVKRINTAVQQAYKPVPPVTDSKPLPPAKNISIAVIQFKTLNKQAQEIALGDLISETFTSALVNSRGFKIIEREQLDKVVKEMEMNQTGFIETTDAVEIGKMLHADAIITGSVALLNKQIQLNARIIEIESAYVISAETKTTTYTLNNITRVVNEIVQKLSRKLIANTHQK